jgi:uncharacterized membrane protein
MLQRANSTVGIGRGPTKLGSITPRWASPLGLLLSLGGLGVSTYLTVAHYAGAAILACPDTGTINCGKVTTSAQSVILGVPVAVIGLAFFVTMLFLNLPVAWQRQPDLVRLTRLGLSTLGVGFAIYLLFTELFVIRAICLWCTAAHVMAFLLFVETLIAESLRRPASAAFRAVDG